MTGADSPAPRENDRIALRTPAKVNLGLRLVGRREDGYHLLESLFAPIDLHDEVEVELGGSGSEGVHLELAPIPADRMPPALAAVTAGPDNLVVRAAVAFLRAASLTRSVEIRLDKRIPAGAGLGGGSSDAAAVLRALNALVDRPLPAAELARVALGLGADVPFFLAPIPSFVSGIGECIEPLEGLPGLDLVVANPGISLATAEVYRAADALGSALTRPGAGSTMRAFSRLRAASDPSGSVPRVSGIGPRSLQPSIRDLLVNDLEPAARRLCPPITRLAQRLAEMGAMAVSLSGSGATVFGVFASADAARRAADRLREAGAEIGGVVWVRATRILSGTDALDR